ncbi:MAG: erythromycin esterase family protein [Actinomycetia bacterium]|nr:erythromycin esterase family protein [Actinomycetes bacterium]
MAPSLPRVRRASPARPSRLAVVCIVFALLAASCSSGDESNGQAAVIGGDESNVEAAVAGGAEDFTEWASDNATPILSLDLDADRSDLDGLASIVGDAQVVAVGETAHNLSEQMQMRTRLLSYLVDTLGFRLLAAETSMPHAERINSYVLGEEADIDELLRQSGTWELMATTQMRSTIEWMRQYNSTVTDDDFVQFYGIDITTPMPALESLDTYLRGVDEALADEMSKEFDGLGMLLGQQGEETWRDLQTRYDEAPGEELAVISTQLGDLVTQM